MFKGIPDAVMFTRSLDDPTKSKLGKGYVAGIFLILSITLLSVQGCQKITPPAPTLIFPVGDTLVRGVPSWKFEWDTIGYPESYNIEIAEDSNFLRVFKADNTMFTFYWYYDTDIESGIYYWRVRSLDYGQYSDWASADFYVISE